MSGQIYNCQRIDWFQDKEDEECRLVLEQEYEIALRIDFEDGRKSKERILICFPEGTNREEIWKWYSKMSDRPDTLPIHGKLQDFIIFTRQIGSVFIPPVC